MSRLTAALATAALLALTACSSSDQPKTQDEIATLCAPALKTRAEGDTSKPEECEGLTDDNYHLLVISSVIDDLGWVDEDGNVDMDKLLQDAEN